MKMNWLCLKNLAQFPALLDFVNSFHQCWCCLETVLLKLTTTLFFLTESLLPPQ